MRYLVLSLVSVLGYQLAVSQETPKAPNERVQLEQARLASRQLAERATAVTMEIGDLAKSGKLPQDEAALEQMKRLVDELAEIRKRLQGIEEDIARLSRAMEGMDEAIPRVRRDLDNLLRHRESNYIQFQYRSTDQRGADNDSFRMRRIRLGFTDRLDAKTSFRVTFDLAANPNLIGPAGTSIGTANTDQSGQLRDAFLDYLAIPPSSGSGLLIRGGQQPMPLGYELERSSAEREFPERAAYNNSLFPGERNRGVQVRYGLNKDFTVGLGVFNALSVNDPEQRSNVGSPGSRLGVTFGARYASPRFSFGASAFVAERAGQQVGYDPTRGAIVSPDIKRSLIYLDGEAVKLFGTDLSARAEAVFGRDRLGLSPVTLGSGSTSAGITDPTSRRLQERPLAGFHLQFAHPINDRNRLAVRYEQFDPDLDRPDNLFRGYGLAWIHQLNPSARLTFAHEIIEDDARQALGQTRYGVTTIRVQYRF